MDAPADPLRLAEQPQAVAFEDARGNRRLRAAALLVLAAIPATLAVLQLGRIHPDEVFQLLEPAWHKAFGYGVLAWEWRQGIRNWVTADFLAQILRLGAWLGVENPQGFRALIALPIFALHALALRAAYLFARRRLSEASAWVATGLLGLYAPVLLYAGRTLSESLSVGFLLIALQLLDRAVPFGADEAGTADRRQAAALRTAALFAGIALGLSVVTRYASSVLVLAALLWLMGQRRWRFLFFTCLGGALVAAGLAASDWADWGVPMRSFLAYVDFNVLSGKAAQQFGAEGPAWYLPLLFRSLPLWALIGVPVLLWREWRERRLSLPVWMGLVYLAAITLTPHKEERFLYPVWVCFSLAGAVGVAQLLERVTSLRLKVVAVSLALLAGLVPFAFKPELRDDQFRAIVKATRAPEVTGLLIVNEGLWGSGGFFYIGKNIVWGTCDWPRDAFFRNAMRDRRFNRAVTFEGRALAELQAHGFRIVATIGRETILAR